MIRRYSTDVQLACRCLAGTKGAGSALVEGATKSGRERVIDLDPQTLDELRRYRVVRAGLALQLARDDALILGDLQCAYFNPDRFSRRFTTAVAACAAMPGVEAIPFIRVHDLRHTHATLLLANGVPVTVVSERRGHATVTITMEIYQHVLLACRLRRRRSSPRS